jgi:hypothetical protein
MALVKWAGFNEENQIGTCTEKGALMHWFLCILAKGVRLKYRRSESILRKNKKADGCF